MELIKKAVNININGIAVPEHLNRPNITIIKVSGNCLNGENIINGDILFIDFSLKPFKDDITLIPQYKPYKTPMIKKYKAGFSNGALVSTNYGGENQDTIAFVNEVNGVAVACSRDGVIVWEKEINQEKYDLHKKHKSNIAYSKLAVKIFFPELFLEMK